MSAENLVIPAQANPHIADAANSFRKVMRKFQAFGQIPESMRGEAHLVGWLLGSGRLREIPAQYRSEFIFEAAVTHELMALAHLKPEETSQYEALALVAIKKNHAQLIQIPDEWQTRDFLIKACINNEWVIRQIDWKSNPLMAVTDDLIRRIGSVSLIHAVELLVATNIHFANRVDEEVIRTAIKHRVSDLHRLKEIDGLPILEKMVKEGYWPDASDVTIEFEYKKGRDYRQAPSNPEEIRSRMEHGMGSSMTLLHDMSMRSFPIEDVIRTLNDEGSLNTLFRIYKDSELRPHMKLSRALRGRFLEQEMGL
jgi:hypothetical protein